MTTKPAEQGQESSPGRRRGRRAGGEDTRAALLAAARAVFAEQGYQGATVRAIATRAGVDAAMVNHWFGGKQGLFAAIVELPFDPSVLLERILDGDRDTLAERLIRTFIPIWDSRDGAFAAVLLSVASQEVAARLLGEFLTTTIFGRVAEVIGADEPMLRATLCASQIVGLGLVRYVLKLPALATADVDTIVATVAPNVQRYLTGELPGLAGGPAAGPR
jgi:AcrR family transcriptional regulator